MQYRIGIERLVTIACLVFIVSSLQAQDPKKETKVVIFKEHKQSQWDTVSVMKNCFKFNPLLFLQGEIPVYYERAISERVSLEVGAGFTTRNYVSLSFSDEADDFGGGVEVKPQFAAHVGFRYYLTDDLEPYGWYLSPEFATRTYLKTINTKDALGNLTETKLDDKRVFNDTKLLLGFQALSGSSNWLVDFYGGVGLRNRALQKVKENIDLVNDTREYSYEFVDDTVVAFFLGFKIGVGF